MVATIPKFRLVCDIGKKIKTWKPPIHPRNAPPQGKGIGGAHAMDDSFMEEFGFERFDEFQHTIGNYINGAPTLPSPLQQLFIPSTSSFYRIADPEAEAAAKECEERLRREYEKLVDQERQERLQIELENVPRNDIFGRHVGGNGEKDAFGLDIDDDGEESDDDWMMDDDNDDDDDDVDLSSMSCSLS